MSKKNNVKNFKVIGCGGIGSNLIDPLCQFLEHSDVPFEFRVHLVDGDKYEPRNKIRQVFDKIGNKATITADRLKKKGFARISFVAIPEYVDAKNIKKLIEEDDVVLLGVDNHKTRKLVSDHAEKLKNLILISGGNEMTDGNVCVHIRQDGENATLPMANKYHPELANPQDKHPAELEAERKKKGCEAVAETTPQIFLTNLNVAVVMLNCLWSIFGGTLGYNEVNFDINLNQSVAKLRE